jgi:hypothetical protein
MASPDGRRRPIIGVMGAAVCDAATYAMARELGRRLGAAGYVFAFARFKGNNMIFWCMLAPLFVTRYVLLISQFQIVRMLHLQCHEGDLGEWKKTVLQSVKNPSKEVAIAVVGSLGFVLSAIYALRLVQESVHGPNHAQWRIADLSARELATLGALAALIFGLGLWPAPVFHAAHSAVATVERALTGRESVGPGLIVLRESERLP